MKHHLIKILFIFLGLNIVTGAHAGLPKQEEAVKVGQAVNGLLVAITHTLYNTLYVRWAASENPSIQNDGAGMIKGHILWVWTKLFMAKGVSFLGTLSDINVTDSYGNTPLHRAVRDGNMELVELLLNAGADVNAANHGGDTPLHIVANNEGGVTFIEALLNAGAEVNVANNLGHTPLYISARPHNVEGMCRLLSAGADVVHNNQLFLEKRFYGYNFAIIFLAFAMLSDNDAQAFKDAAAFLGPWGNYFMNILMTINANPFEVFINDVYIWFNEQRDNAQRGQQSHFLNRWGMLLRGLIRELSAFRVYLGNLTAEEMPAHLTADGYQHLLGLIDQAIDQLGSIEMPIEEVRKRAS